MIDPETESQAAAPNYLIRQDLEPLIWQAMLKYRVTGWQRILYRLRLLGIYSWLMRHSTRA